jgi:hypothetical protein
MGIMPPNWLKKDLSLKSLQMASLSWGFTHTLALATVKK